MTATATPTREALVASFRTQASGCAENDSSIYARLRSFQSVVWWVLPASERERVTAPVSDAGVRARAEAPLAWLRMEGVRRDDAELRLTLWPGGADRLLAHVHWHGAWVHGSG